MPVRWGVVGAAALAVVLVLSAPVASQANFPGRNGDLVVFSQVGFSSSLHFVSPAGTVRKTIDAFTGFGGFRGSPDGRQFLFVQVGDGIWVSDLYGVDRRRVVRGGEQPAWAPDGRHVVYVRKGSVWVSRLDGRGTRLVTRLWRGVPSGWGSRDAEPAWSPDGRTIVFVRHRLAGSRCTSRTDLYAVSVQTHMARLIFRPALRCGTVSLPDWSPDGRKLVVTVGESPQIREPVDPRGAALDGITVLRADGKLPKRITRRYAPAVWSPDGQHLAYTDFEPKQGGGLVTALHIVDANGAEGRTIAAFRDSGNGRMAPAWLVQTQRRSTSSGALPTVATGQRGLARLQVPDKAGRYHNSTAAHTAFLLPRGRWQAVSGKLGWYRQTVRSSDAECVLQLQVGGQIRAHKPRLADGGFNVTAHGQRGTLHWVTGAHIAIARMPTPPWVSTSKPWTRFIATVGLVNDSNRCAAPLAGVSLQDTISRIHVAAGRVT